MARRPGAIEPDLHPDAFCRIVDTTFRTHRLHLLRVPQGRILYVPLGEVHSRLELANLHAGGDVGAPHDGIAPHDVKQTPDYLAPQSVRPAGREEDSGVHEATALGTDVIRVAPYRTALDPFGLEALRITERVVEAV